MATQLGVKRPPPPLVMLEQKVHYMSLIGQMVRASPADEVDDVDELGPDGKARARTSRRRARAAEDVGAQLLAWWRLLGVIKARETGGGGDEGKKKKERSGIFGRIGGRQHKKGANLGLDDKQAEELRVDVWTAMYTPSPPSRSSASPCSCARWAAADALRIDWVGSR